MPSILFPASALNEGAINSRNPAPVAAATPAIAAPARNFRRFRYKLLGVISDERMSAAFLMSMRTPVSYTRFRRERISTRFYFQSDKTQRRKKSYRRVRRLEV